MPKLNQDTSSLIIIIISSCINIFLNIFFFGSVRPWVTNDENDNDCFDHHHCDENDDNYDYDDS